MPSGRRMVGKKVKEAKMMNNMRQDAAIGRIVRILPQFPAGYLEALATVMEDRLEKYLEENKPPIFILNDAGQAGRMDQSAGRKLHRTCVRK